MYLDKMIFLDEMIIDMEQLSVLTKFEDGVYQTVGTVYFPTLVGHSGPKFFRSQSWSWSKTYDLVFLSIETLEEYLGLNVIFYRSFRPTQRTNKKTMLQTLEESRYLIKNDYKFLKREIDRLDYYLVVNDDDELE